MTEIHLGPQGHFQEAVLPRYRALAASMILSAIKDLRRSQGGSMAPYEATKRFLTTDSIWHQLLDLDPAKVERYIRSPDDIEALYQSLKKAENKYLNRGKSPGMPGNMIPGARTLKERGELGG